MQRNKNLNWEYFVWVKGMRGPTPQVWGRDYSELNSMNKPKDDVLQKHPMTEEDQGKNLNELAIKYPYVEKAGEGIL